MAPPSKRPRRNVGPLSTGRILNSTSPILSKDIHSFLVSCISGWATNYTQVEKRAIIDTLPPPYRIFDIDEDGNIFCPLTVDFVHSDPFIKAAVAKLKTDVGEGCYERSWQTKARRAMQERRDGKFDEYLKEHTDQLFGEGRQLAGADGNGRGDKDTASSESDWEKVNEGKRGDPGGRRPPKVVEPDKESLDGISGGSQGGQKVS